MTPPRRAKRESMQRHPSSGLAEVRSLFPQAAGDYEPRAGPALRVLEPLPSRLMATWMRWGGAVGAASLLIVGAWSLGQHEPTTTITDHVYSVPSLQSDRIVSISPTGPLAAFVAR